MSDSPLDLIVSKISGQTEFNPDEIYTFLILNRYGSLNKEEILEKYDGKIDDDDISVTLSILEEQNLVKEQDETFEPVRFDKFYERIEDKVEVTLAQIEALEDLL